MNSSLFVDTWKEFVTILVLKEITRVAGYLYSRLSRAKKRKNDRLMNKLNFPKIKGKEKNLTDK